MTERPLNDAQRRLAADHVELVDKAVSKMQGRYAGWVDRDELRSAGLFALTRLAGRYDSRQAAFVTYAWPRIVGALIDAIREHNGRRSIKNAQRVPRQQLVSFESLRDERDFDIETSDPDLDRVVELDALDRALALLPERDRMIVALWGYEDLSQREISEALGISESRVHQIIKRVLPRLRGALRPAA